MKQLRLPILVLLTAALLLVTVPAPAATPEWKPASPGWMSQLLNRLLDGLPWGLPVAAVEDESATDPVPLPTHDTDDPAVQGSPVPDDSSGTESGHQIDPDG